MSHSKKKPRLPSHQSGSDADCKTLYVGVRKSKFPNYITSKHLRQHFAEFEGDISNVMIVRDQETKESKGYGFVTFTSREATVNAIEKLKGTRLLDKFPLFMNFKKSESGGSVQQHSSELFFKGMKSRLPNYIHSRHIRDHFAEFEADIVRTVVVSDPQTKTSKGFGFIKFTSDRTAEDAQKKLHGSMLLGKFPLHVKLRKPSNHLASSKPSPADNYDFDSDGDSTSEISEDGSQDSEVPDNSTLYVSVWNSKFPNFVNSRHLEAHFSAFEEHIIKVQIMRNSETHETKGYGFVQFKTSVEAGKAMKRLRGSKLLEKFPLYINYQKPTLTRSILDSSGGSSCISTESVKQSNPLQVTKVRSLIARESDTE